LWCNPAGDAGLWRGLGNRPEIFFISACSLFSLPFHGDANYSVFDHEPRDDVQALLSEIVDLLP
jgi:hypothetical protein